MPAGLVIGGDGLIGAALKSRLADTGWQVTSTTRRNTHSTGQRFLDLRSPMASLAGWPDRLQDPGLVVFFAAAATGYARCAEDPAGTWLVNVDNTVALASEFMRDGAFVVYLSSNAVFDGTAPGVPEDAPTSPDTEYGRQKAACEAGLQQAAAGASSGAAIVRLTKVLNRDNALVGGWIRDLRGGSRIRAATDLVLSPITPGYVVDCLVRIAMRRRAGTYHLSGSMDVTYFGLAMSIAASLGCEAHIEEDRVRTRLGNVPAPLQSALGMRQTTRIFDIHPQPLHDVTGSLLAQD